MLQHTGTVNTAPLHLCVAGVRPDPIRAVYSLASQGLLCLQTEVLISLLRLCHRGVELQDQSQALTSQ